MLVLKILSLQTLQGINFQNIQLFLCYIYFTTRTTFLQAFFINIFAFLKSAVSTDFTVFQLFCFNVFLAIARV